ncbi:MAG: twin-arginine translocase TatA/TatE family subunit [Deltaproteobacteria bacterium]|nr:twin-arginine translocase TatA/TatE family subunit [Deltaproteobacteria bacterium]
MCGVNIQEALIILFVVALVLGAGRLPQIGDGLGRAVRNFKKSLKGDNEIDVTPKKLPPNDEPKHPPAGEPPPSS